MREEYDIGWRITDVMPINSVGIVTARDSLTIHFDKSNIWETVLDFMNLPPDQARTKYDLGADARDWKVALAQVDLKKSNVSQQKITPVLYRPFDTRFTYYTGVSRGFHCMPRGEVMTQMLVGKNIGLAIGRAGQVIGEGEWNILFVSTGITEFNLYRRGGNNLFPLYLYSTEKKGLFDEDNNGERKPNLAPEFIAAFAEKLNLRFSADTNPSANAGGTDSGDADSFTPEDVFYYAYAVFHSPTYRSRYAEFLKIDFPRLPLTSNFGLFRALTALGGELVSLHLFERDAPELVGFPVGGDNAVEFVKYEAGKVYINKTQYFDGVPQEVWEFHIGGYRVAEKWLKDRKSRTLNFDDLEHYQKTIAALARTIEIMSAIDETIEENGGFPIS